MLILEVIYKNWDSDHSPRLEEIQADIFNKNNKNANVTGEQIKQRYDSEKIDPETVRYAFTKDENPLAYCQARDYNVNEENEETHLGFPWSLEGCPKEVQEKLFNDLLEYIKARKKKVPIKINIAVNNKEQVEFIKAREFKVASEFYRSSFNVNTILEKTFDNEGYSSRIATENDLELLVETSIADKNLGQAFKTREEFVTYFKDRVFKDGPIVLIFKGEDFIAAYSPLHYNLNNEENQSLIFRFVYIAEGNDNAWPLFLSEMAKAAKNKNWDEKPLVIFIPEDDPRTKLLEKFKPEKILTNIQYLVHE